MKQELRVSDWVARRDLLGFGIVGAALGIVSWRAVQRPIQDGASILPATDAHARAQAGSLTLIDIRRPDEWRDTGLPEHAHPLDMRRPDFVDALRQIVGPDRYSPVALICARGVRSDRLARELANAGFSNVVDVSEGMLGSSAGPGWIARGLPVTMYKGDDA